MDNSANFTTRRGKFDPHCTVSLSKTSVYFVSVTSAKLYSRVTNVIGGFCLDRGTNNEAVRHLLIDTLTSVIIALFGRKERSSPPPILVCFTSCFAETIGSKRHRCACAWVQTHQWLTTLARALWCGSLFLVCAVPRTKRARSAK